MDQLRLFIKTMTEFLDKHPNLLYNFIIINQSNISFSREDIISDQDTIKFNRGSLINIGFNIINNYNTYDNKQFDSVIIHDIDLIPDESMINEYIKLPINTIHLASSWASCCSSFNCSLFSSCISNFLLLAIGFKL